MGVHVEKPWVDVNLVMIWLAGVLNRAALIKARLRSHARDRMTCADINTGLILVEAQDDSDTV